MDTGFRDRVESIAFKSELEDSRDAKGVEFLDPSSEVVLPVTSALGAMILNLI